jgi:hypothetical protein
MEWYICAILYFIVGSLLNCMLAYYFGKNKSGFPADEQLVVLIVWPIVILLLIPTIVYVYFSEKK